MLLAASFLRRAEAASYLRVGNRLGPIATSTKALAGSTMPSPSENLVDDVDGGDRDQQHQRPRRAVPASKLIAANVYISEGRDRAIIYRLVQLLGGWKGCGRSDEADVNSFDFTSGGLEKAVSTSTSTSSSSAAAPAPAPAPAAPAAAALVHVFVDEPYNRTGFTISGLSSSSSSEEEEREGNGTGSTRDGGKGVPSTSSALSSVPAAISLLARESLRLIDWRLAGGTHPAIGVVDHVAVHALFPESEGAKEEATKVARRVAQSLGELGVPTYLYGSASCSPDNNSAAASNNASEWKRLAEVRRALGYFSASSSSESSAAAALSSSSSFFARFPTPLPKPDSGPGAAEASKGAAAVGSVPWVMNVNVPLVVEGGEGGGGGGGGGGEGGGGKSSEATMTTTTATAATTTQAAASSVARAVSARRGTPVSEGGFALPGVEALALAHRPGVVEIACNLTDGSVQPEEVARAVERAARSAGFGVLRKKKEDENENENENGDDDSNWYVTGKRPEEVAAEAAGALGLEIVK